MSVSKVGTPLFILLSLILPSTGLTEFSWKDESGKHLDLFFGDRAVSRFVYEAIDESSKERREETYKPFCHIYRWWSKDQFLTKGPGGKFTHHRGIFYGFSKVSYNDAKGNTYSKIDTWHCRQAAQIHREFLAREASAEYATLTSRIEWTDNDGKPFAEETRSLTFQYKGGDLYVDFDSLLSPLVPEIRLDGDPQHAGFQFRASNEVHESTAKKTYYIRPGTGAAKPGETINWSNKNDTEATRDLPWKGMCVEVGEKRYTIAYLDHPDNPKPARYSERDYGRFGSYFATTVTDESPLEVRYRLVIRQGEMTKEDIESFQTEFVSS
ncbi:MAG: DUF6807 family protein [Verrucomicrobiota bacterium]